jgi:hypothetical protein
MFAKCQLACYAGNQAADFHQPSVAVFPACAALQNYRLRRRLGCGYSEQDGFAALAIPQVPAVFPPTSSADFVVGLDKAQQSIPWRINAAQGCLQPFCSASFSMNIPLALSLW